MNTIQAADIAAALQQTDDHNLHGLLFQHIELCETRTWLHYHRIDCAHLNRHMQAGLLLHDTAYGGEAARGLAGFGIKPDMLDFARREVSEVKRSRSNEAAAVGQLRFYLAVLERASGQAWTGILRYPQSRRTKRMAFDDAQRAAFAQAVQRIIRVIQQPRPPAKQGKPLCAECSYRMVCWQQSTEDGDY